MTLPSWFKPFALRIRLIAARAVVHLIDDAAKLQLLQVEVLSGETRDQVERFQEYGYTSCPLPGAEAVALSIDANRNHMVAIKVDDRRYRKTNLKPGEVAMYTDEGDYILMKRGRIIEVNSGAHVKVIAPQCTIDAASTHITGTLQIDGAITCGSTVAAIGQINSTTGVSANGIELGTHVHGGVTTGTANTGVPQ